MRLFAAALVVLTIVPADAGFVVCNRAHVPTNVALGRFDGKVWRSEGWWTIAPQKCTTVLSGPLDARFYYLYGTDGGTGTWSGRTPFCTANVGPFSIPGQGNCAARGYVRRGFFVVDTGDRPDWTQTLSD